jgi:hypothetical protein
VRGDVKVQSVEMRRLGDIDVTAGRREERKCVLDAVDLEVVEQAGNGAAEFAVVSCPDGTEVLVKICAPRAGDYPFSLTLRGADGGFRVEGCVRARRDAVPMERRDVGSLCAAVGFVRVWEFPLVGQGFRALVEEGPVQAECVNGSLRITADATAEFRGPISVCVENDEETLLIGASLHVCEAQLMACPRFEAGFRASASTTVVVPLASAKVSLESGPVSVSAKSCGDSTLVRIDAAKATSQVGATTVVFLVYNGASMFRVTLPLEVLEVIVLPRLAAEVRTPLRFTQAFLPSGARVEIDDEEMFRLVCVQHSDEQSTVVIDVDTSEAVETELSFLLIRGSQRVRVRADVLVWNWQVVQLNPLEYFGDGGDQTYRFNVAGVNAVRIVLGAPAITATATAGSGWIDVSVKVSGAVADATAFTLEVESATTHVRASGMAVRRPLDS